MRKKEIDITKYTDIPHFEIIKKDEKIVIPSVFMFDGIDSLFTFLHACRVFNCTVLFENENMEVEPKEDDSCYHLKLSIYMTIKTCKSAFGDYLRYLTNIDEMKWENCT